MAGIIEGLFTDPNSFRNERLDNLMAQQARQSQMGGSYNQLLGQVAAQGNIMGQMGAEAAAGMFGMSTPEEAKAAELQAMSQSYDLQSPEGVAEFAKSLNGLGYTKEAITMMDRFRTLKQDKDREEDRKRAEEDRQERIAKSEIRPRRGVIMVPDTDSKGRPKLDINGEPIMVPKNIIYDEEWDPKTRDWYRDEASVRDEPQTLTGAEGRMPAGKTVSTPAGDIDYNTMTNSTNKPVQDMWSSLSNWWNSQ